jgi:selenium metabolism protein YedF
MMNNLDARGLTCPAPVLMVKDLVEKEKPNELTVIVDNAASSENVGRFLATRNYLVSEEHQNGDFYLLARRKEGGEQSVQTPAPLPECASGMEVRQKILVFVTSSCLGHGDDLLGGKLMANYLKTLREIADDLWQLIFVNSGVKLTIDSSPVLAELLEYERKGVIILVCGTCLEHFQLTALKKVGATTNMLDIVVAMQLADKVISVG